MRDGEIVGGVLGCPNLPRRAIPRTETKIQTCDRGDGGVMFAAFKGLGCFAMPLRDADAAVRYDAATRCATNGYVVDGAVARYAESWGDSIVADHARTNALASSLGIATAGLQTDRRDYFPYDTTPFAR